MCVRCIRKKEQKEHREKTREKERNKERIENHSVRGGPRKKKTIHPDIIKRGMVQIYAA